MPTTYSSSSSGFFPSSKSFQSFKSCLAVIFEALEQLPILPGGSSWISMKSSNDMGYKEMKTGDEN